MSRHYSDATQLAVPLFVLRALAAAGQKAVARPGGNADEVEAVREALDWLASRPILKENILDP